MLHVATPHRFNFQFHTERMLRELYATDASEYQELPLAVAFPEKPEHIRELIEYAAAHQLSLIPRGAGTSLAGQVVGNGIVVDAGRHLNQILSINTAQRRVRVQPGVVRNELNHALQPHGIVFGPETSTANRAMIGGMVGNNSCGSNSLAYGSTREHLVSCKGYLSDGSEVIFEALSPTAFNAKCEEDSLEAAIYQKCRELLSNSANRALITKHYPKRSIPRRNTGYALDLLMDAEVFDPSSDKPFNLCKLIAGSEGTLFFGTEFELDCDPLPPKHSALLCAHFNTIDQALRSVLPALNSKPFGVELLDRHILEATKRNRDQAKNRFFVQGDPGAILVVDIRRETEDSVDEAITQVTTDIQAAGYGTHFPVLKGADESKVWELRRAGQGLVSNLPGHEKPREVCEDTAVDVTELADYIAEFDQLMREKHGKECVYYAHAGSGELHTRPIFNLKTEAGLKTFRAVAEDVAALVKKYNGSLSGEHGDGRLRGEFIPFMVGDQCFAMMRQIKEAFDPENRFNPGKIIDTPPMDSHLRYGPKTPDPHYATIFDFSSNKGILNATENCNGSGDCRKGPLAGGTMCPSYMATRNEKDSTRGRANTLRHALTNPVNPLQPFDNESVKDVLDLCLSCKGCKSECPSNVDMAKLKAEFTQHYYDANGVPLRTKLIANFTRSSQLASYTPWLWNGIVNTPVLRKTLNKLIGFHPDRTIPRLHRTTLIQWHQKQTHVSLPPQVSPKRVYLFCDEFTNFNDVPIGQKTVQLLERLGYEVIIPKHLESARTWLSKGLIRKAKQIANANVRQLAPLISTDTPLIGIEPSAILGFRDEYIDLADGELKDTARILSQNCLMLDEFLVREFDAGRIRSDQFQAKPTLIKLHGHCFQKALASVVPTVRALQIPDGYKVHMIPSGCCGMAGSFGYEKEHYELSMQIGELVLFPSVRNTPSDVLIAASGTSCRHQIHDGTGRTALHPAEILFDALIQSEQRQSTV
ncbi:MULTISPECIES: FAD-binding and (Fe-S)-binding domain-containing protein [unclassified Lentimonas]|uniref:FAD-binding and (Fe-S)-binding domain-containing protein n=1 Tax=unclassified Lentimonas TaxID=2630993 RepID=UPI00132BBF99|nr:MULTISPECIES: FAD-binding and (Fe-S)-binding domain-containing protein [unclassified Lentimonas]CAA6678735.1 Glycolate dehydrogenase (EC, subunit GlcD [Lentimonas sp. CC4]CAA6683721.1 Glycolate dehydrogenase (EC, subunit GlcD [Lentimonas sp. CC6]CAA7074431.1 Glycolate dehydrogenase (EC, subunit GlcD [Lentimonas sp. CC4]CAA7169041.1 Glycolate dehydrogenase (EC, subunit GlcD [Lentimonas sp. CC21]CAA7180552.1 Glycolate dehydrogenase (EC, subunit GlcD [Lentimonas sp. CC8]